ncbi:MAG: RDD family protein [Bacteroidota bacterium]
MRPDLDWQAQVEVVTPESVSFTYEAAGIGSRFLALLVDHLIESFFFLAILIAVSALGWADNRYMMLLILSGMTLVYVGYFILFEILWDGQTPGKRLMRLRVVREGGYGLTALEAILRNLVRVVDFLPVFYGVGLASMFLSRKSRRLGDYAGGTVVVKDRGSVAPGLQRAADPRILEEFAAEEQALLRVKAGLLSGEELRVMREFLTRRAGITLENRRNLAGKLVFALLSRAPELREIAASQPAERLIEAIVAAHEETMH